MSDIDIIAKIRDKDSAFITDIYKRVKPAFVNFMVSQFHIDSEQAAEFFQEAIYIMYCNIKDEKLIQLTTKIETYLIGIGKNLASNDYRNKQRLIRNYFLLSNVSTNLINQIDFEKEFETRTELIRIAVRELKEPCNKILSLFYWAEINYAEMLKKLPGFTSIDSLKAQKYKCMKRLKSKLLAAFQLAGIS